MNIHIRELSKLDRASLVRHFLALDGADRRLRFGVPLNDSAVRAYVARIDFERDTVFGVHDDALRLIGAAHLARSDGHAELGVSVLPAIAAAASAARSSRARICAPAIGACAPSSCTA
jgi:hypothetical protein